MRVLEQARAEVGSLTLCQALSSLLASSWAALAHHHHRHLQVASANINVCIKVKLKVPPSNISKLEKLDRGHLQRCPPIKDMLPC